MSKALEDVLKAIDKAKGMDTVIYRIKDHNPFVEYAVITTASNVRQLQAIAGYVRDVLLQNNYGFRHIEGDDTSKWLLVDSDDIVIHIFEENERDVYGLEKIYANCERVKDVSGIS